MELNQKSRSDIKLTAIIAFIVQNFVQNSRESFMTKNILLQLHRESEKGRLYEGINLS